MFAAGAISGAPVARKTERQRHGRFLEATFVKSAASLADCPRDAVPEIAFIGRSNAGKSSTLNALTRSRKLARVSRTPGRTQLINLFDARLPWTGQRARLVDLPGYGYAKASKAKQASWGRAVWVTT